MIRGDELVFEQQILGRVADDGEFGEHHQVGIGRRDLPPRGEDAIDVAIDVADDRINLRECDAERHVVCPISLSFPIERDDRTVRQSSPSRGSIGSSPDQPVLGIADVVGASRSVAGSDQRAGNQEVG